MAFGGGPRPGARTAAAAFSGDLAATAREGKPWKIKWLDLLTVQRIGHPEAPGNRAA